MVDIIDINDTSEILLTHLKTVLATKSVISIPSINVNATNINQQFQSLFIYKNLNSYINNNGLMSYLDMGPSMVSLINLCNEVESILRHLDTYVGVNYGN